MIYRLDRFCTKVFFLQKKLAMLELAHAKLSPYLNELPPTAHRGYVKLLMLVLSRATIAASHSNPVVSHEVKGFPVGMTIQMIVLPNIASFCLEVTEQKTFRLYQLKADQRPDLSIKFKQLTLGFKVLSLQEAMAVAFANDRIVADGDVSDAIRFVRCLNQVQAMILPESLANLAVKQVPKMSFTEKLVGGVKLLKGSFRTG